MRRFILAFFLLGCASEPVDIRLSPDAETAYEAFLSDSTMAVFAVSKDGDAWGYSFCRDFYDCRHHNARKVALDSCGEFGRNCVVYDVKGY